MAPLHHDDATTRILGSEDGQQDPPRRENRTRTTAVLVTLAFVAIAAVLAVLLVPRGDEEGEILAATSARVSPSIDRLSSTARQTMATRPASFVALRSAAERAIDQLGDEEARFGTLDSNVRDKPSVVAYEDAMEATRQLAEAMASPRPRPALVSGLASEQQAAVDGLVGPGLPVVATRQVVASLRRRAMLASTDEPSPFSSPPTLSPENPPAEPALAALPDYATRNAFGYQARVPTGGGWGAPADSQPNSRLYRTNVRGPDGLFLIIDYTPQDEAVFGGDYESETEVGQTAFGTATEYVFQGGSLPECQRSPCVDYIINDPVSTQGFAVLAGGGDLTLVRQIARTVMESLTPDAE